MSIDLEPRAVFDIFSEISKIPRGSGNEAAIASHIVAWAKEKGLWSEKDAANNVIIKKPGSPEKENHPSICLQAHLDMVCEKTAESKHDFTKDPISIQVRDDYLCADGTTLGADNGIGLALIMAILADPAAEHPPLEILFTSSEEAGMKGAWSLVESGRKFTSKALINLDSGWEGVFISGAAGGGRVDFFLPAQWEEASMPCFRIDVCGLLGGHSGAEIHLGRANANQILARVLNSLSIPWRLVSMGGGGKDNAIARDAYAIICCQQEAALYSQIARLQTMLQREYHTTDPGLKLLVSTTSSSHMMTSEASTHARQFLLLLPFGVLSRDHSLDLTVTSMNIGSCCIEGDQLVVRCSIRSSIPSHLSHWLLPQLHTLAECFGAQMSEHDFYPGWNFRQESPIRSLAMQTYQSITGSTPSFRVLHGGLECGILMEHFGFTDAISYGPELNCPHSPQENLRISSVAIADKLIRQMLKSL